MLRATGGWARVAMSVWLAVCLMGLQASIVELMPGEDPDDPLQAAYVLVDQSASLDLGQVRQQAHLFERNTSGFINPGTTAGVVWVRFDVRNSTSRPGAWVISLNRALVSPGAIYLDLPDESVTLLPDSVEAYAGSYREFGTLAARFELPAQTSATLYIKYRGGNWSGLVPSLTTDATLQQQITTNLVVLFALIGGVLTLVLYVSVSFVVLDRQVVFLYIVAQIAWLSFYIHFTGFTTTYLWPQYPQWGRIVAPLTMAISVLAIVQFARHFFGTRPNLPRLDRFLLALLAVVAGAVLMLVVAELVDLVPRQLPLYVIYASTFLAWLTVTPLACFATIKWDRDLWPLTISWSLMLIFMVTMQLVWTGAIDSVPLNEHLYGVFIYAEAVFMALGIALRIRRMRVQRIDAERRLSTSLAAELAATQRAVRLAEEREWALGDLAEKGRLILAAGHDTRQMISSLRHYALGLQRSANPARVAAAGTALQQIATNLDEVLGTAINGSASGGIGDRTIALELVSPDQILTPLKLIYGGMAAERGIELRMHMTSKPMVTDRVLVARIVSNLLSNALKYTDTGKVLVTCRAGSHGHRFQVFDTGHGLAPQALQMLLSRNIGAVQFERGADGHGAGLHIAKELAARVGGVLNGRSTPGRGSVFELLLPNAGTTSGARETLNVVVLDTADRLPEALLQEARAHGLDVHCTEDAHAARQRIRQHGGLFLIDEHFGGALAGLELARNMVRESPRATVAVMTYDRSIEARMRSVDARALLLYKPLSVGLLLAAAGRHDSGRQAPLADSAAD
jgi:two-component system, sensor histidine kinase LadS